jgi:hypothetical protein
MAKPCTLGIDSVIPVVMMGDHNPDWSGPLFGEWTNEQEEAQIRSCRISSSMRRIATERASLKYDLLLMMGVSLNRQTARSNIKRRLTYPIKSVYFAYPQLWLESRRSQLVVNSVPTANIYRRQLPIIADGLTAKTYKCLDGRPNVSRMVKLSRDGQEPC